MSVPNSKPDTEPSPAPPDPYARCPHVRETIEHMLERVKIQPFQPDAYLGAQNAEDHITHEREHLREEFIKKFLDTETRALAAARQNGLTIEELRRKFPFTPLPTD